MHRFVSYGQTMVMNGCDLKVFDVLRYHLQREENFWARVTNTRPISYDKLTIKPEMCSLSQSYLTDVFIQYGLGYKEYLPRHIT